MVYLVSHFLHGGFFVGGGFVVLKWLCDVSKYKMALMCLSGKMRVLDPHHSAQTTGLLAVSSMSQWSMLNKVF